MKISWIKKIFESIKTAFVSRRVVRSYRRMMLRYIIKYIKKNHYEGLTPIFGSNEKEGEIIAWKWLWSVALENEINKKVWR